MEIWTVKDVMAYLKVSRSTVYRRMEDGVLPFIDGPGHRRLIADSVIDSVTDGERRGKPKLARTPGPRRRPRVEITAELLLDLGQQH